MVLRMRSRLVFLSTLPLGAIPFNHFCVETRRIDIELLKYIVKEAKFIDAEFISYIRHEATLNLLNKILDLNLGPSPGLYQWQPSDTIIIVSLKRGIILDPHDVEPEDLEIFYVYVSKICY